MRKVLALFNNAEVTLKLEECNFLMKAINYLGRIIRTRQLEIALHTTDAIRGHKDPANMTELRSFLGLCIDFRRFVSNFARYWDLQTINSGKINRRCFKR